MKDHSKTKTFQEMTPEEQDEQNYFDLTEIKDYYGDWNKVREIIDMLEDNENEAAFQRWSERRYSIDG